MLPTLAPPGRLDVGLRPSITRAPVPYVGATLSEAEHAFLERRSSDVDLEWLELRAGIDVLEVGCGTGGMCRRVARAVAPGRVVGVDIDLAVIEYAQRASEGDTFANLAFRQGDVADLAEFAESFDLVFTRSVLMYVADPVNALVQQRRAARSGGRVVALGEGDWGTAVVHPGVGLISDAIASMEASIAAVGGDSRIGRRLLGMFEAAGLRDVTVSEVVGSASITPGSALAEAPWLSLLSALVDRIQPNSSTGNLADGVRVWAAEPGALLIWPRVIRARGRR